jgi:hypothetical protein
MKTIKKVLWLLSISLCVTAAYVSAQTPKHNLAANTEVKFPVAAPAAEENYLNTVTTTGPDGTRYKLVQIGDKLPRLYVNSKLVQAEDMDRYGALIENLMPVLWQRQKDAGRAKSNH